MTGERSYGRVRDMALQDRILRFMRPKQEKQRAAWLAVCEKLRPEERPVFRAHVEPPTTKQVDAQSQRELDLELANLVERGTLVVQPWGRTLCYEITE